MRKAYRVYGSEGHRQRESFSRSYGFKPYGKDIRVDVHNADMTGTHEYTDVIVYAHTEADADDEMMAQLSDGIFENSRVGRVEIVKEVQ